MCSGKNTLWIHEEDVPWLITYMAEEPATGGVVPIDDADGDMEEECQQRSQGLILDGAAVAAPSEADPVTPAKATKALGKMRWDFNGAWEAVISQGPQKGTTASCRVNTMTAEKWAFVSKSAQVQGGVSERDFPVQEDCCEAFLGATPAGLPRRGPGAVSARSCWWMRFTCGRSWGSCGRGGRGSGGGAVDGLLQDAVRATRPSGVRRQRETERKRKRTRESERERARERERERERGVEVSIERITVAERDRERERDTERERAREVGVSGPREGVEVGSGANRVERITVACAAPATASAAQGRFVCPHPPQLRLLRHGRWRSFRDGRDYAL